MRHFSIKKIIFSPFFVFLLFEVLLFVTNYVPGTYFLGWDNLFPEMNFPANFQRIFTGIWQEYRGLGLLDGMSFAANLPHYLVLNVFSLVLPKDLLRYFFVFLMHFIGGIGVYYLLFELFNRPKNKKIVFIFSGLFYQLNLITVQMFFATYEVFAVHFAFLPLLLYLAVKFLRTGLKKDLVWFGIFSFFGVSQAHVPTLFIVYLIALFSFLGIYILKDKKMGIKRAITILLLTFVINAFWGLPYLYSAFQNSKIIANSKINLMSTEDVYLKNKAYGDLKNIILMKGFSFDFVDIQSNEVKGYMMQSWRDHTQNPLFIIASFIFFSLSLIGLIKVVVKKETRFYPVILLFLFSFLMLGNNIPIVKAISSFLYSHIPYFSQIFRFTFTKFSILYALSFSILLTIGLSVVLNKAAKVRYLVLVIFLGTFLLLGYEAFPSFKGNFLYKNLRVKVPDSYFEVVNYFNSQNKNTRIASLPQPSFYGWTYTRWGYRGSGFIWYGIPQATLDGAFYPWSRENENYYWEISYALYSKNKELFGKVLEKYQINWLLVDGNIINPESRKALFLDELEEILQENSINNKFELVKTFGKIKIYKFNIQTPFKNYINLTSNLSSVNAYEWGNNDKAFVELGDYVSTDNLDVYYPFRSLFTGRKTEELEVEIEDLNDKFIFKKTLPKEITNYELIIPPYNGNELVSIDPNDFSKMNYLIPVAEIKNGKLEVTVPKATGLLSAEIDPTKISEALIAKNCNQFSPGKGVSNTVFSDLGGQKDWLRLEAEDANNCSARFYLPNLMHEYSYLIGIESRNISGKTLLFWLENLTNQKADLEVNLKSDSFSYKLSAISYFIQPPMARDGLGYTLHFDNISIGNEKTINDLGKISVYQIPYNFLTGIKLVQSTKNKIQSDKTKLRIENVSHPNPSVYEIKIDSETVGNMTLVLSQAYHQGWKAYQLNSKCKISTFAKASAGKQNSKLFEFFPFLFGKEIKDHVLVNNWENGWLLPENFKGEMVIIFWPQYLEYLGLGLLGITTILIIILPKIFKKTKQ